MNIDELISHIGRPKKLAQRDLSKFERTSGFRFPEDYRSFLLKCDGGYVGGTVTYEPKSKRGTRTAYNDVVIDTIGGVNRRDGNLSQQIALHAPFIPSTLVWIMDDSMGNAVCLGVRGRQTGKLYFWDHEYDPADGASHWAQITRIAADFSSFLDGLVSDA